MLLCNSSDELTTSLTTQKSDKTYHFRCYQGPWKYPKIPRVQNTQISSFLWEIEYLMQYLKHLQIFDFP